MDDSDFPYTFQLDSDSAKRIIGGEDAGEVEGKFGGGVKMAMCGFTLVFWLRVSTRAGRDIGSL